LLLYNYEDIVCVEHFGGSVSDRNTMSGRQFLVDYDAYQTIAVWWLRNVFRSDSINRTTAIGANHDDLYFWPTDKRQGCDLLK
jgi:hypothetical protein